MTALLPGLYLALLAFLLDRALRRWWEPVPARVWGVFGVVLLILFGPALFLGRVLLPVDILPGVAQPEDARKAPQGNVLQNDLVTQVVPLQAQVRREVRTGAWPLWNDLAGAGMPLLADPQSQTFEPLALAALPLPLPAAVALTAGLAAPGLVPAFRYIPQSLRHRWVEARNERLGANPEIGIHESAQGVRQRVVLVFAPNAFGNSRYGEYWGVTNNNEDSSAFVGGAALLAALLAFLPASRRFSEERIFLVLAPVSLLIAVHLPGVRLLSAKLPVLNQSLGANRRLLLLVAFSLAYLGACTVERWRTGAGPKRWAVLVSALVLLGLIAWGYLLSADMKALAALRWFWMGTQLAAVAGTAVVLSLGCRRASTLVLCALTAIELLIFHQPANPSLPRSAYYPVTPLIRFLQENADGTRIAGLETRILPNAAAVYGLADVRISDPLKPFAYAQAVGPVSAAVRSTEHVLTAPEHPLYQLLGVRFVVAPPRMNSIRGLRRAFHDPTGRIFERERLLPRLFLPASTATAGAESWP